MIKLWYIIQSFFADSEKLIISSHNDSGMFIDYICYVHIIVISAVEDSSVSYAVCLMQCPLSSDW